MAATTRKKKPTAKKKGRKVPTPTPKRRKVSKAELSRRATKGVATRRRNAREAAKRHAKRVEAGKKAYRTRLAKERLREALRAFREAVKREAPSHLVDKLKASYQREKYRLESGTEDYEQYLAILDELADDEAPDWDIAYGSTESAA